MRQFVAFAIAFAGALAALAAGGSPYAEDKAIIPSVAPADASALTHLSCKGGPNEIRVVVRNVKKAQGLITADLYGAKEEGFLHKEARVGRISVAAKSPVTFFCLTAPSASPHAVAVYQDRNANKKFDKTGLGLPDEPYGVSNNPKMRFAPPKAAEALFPVDEVGASIEIMLKK